MPPKRPKPDGETNEVGGAGRDRTDDLLLATQVLSQLSYGPALTDCESFGRDMWAAKESKKQWFCLLYTKS